MRPGTFVSEGVAVFSSNRDTALSLWQARNDQLEHEEEIAFSNLATKFRGHTVQQK